MERTPTAPEHGAAEPCTSIPADDASPWICLRRPWKWTRSFAFAPWRRFHALPGTVGAATASTREADWQEEVQELDHNGSDGAGAAAEARKHARAGTRWLGISSRGARRGTRLCCRSRQGTARDSDT